MKFSLKKPVSVLLIMLMLLNVMPISSLAGTEEPFIKLRGAGSDETFDCTVSVSVPNDFPVPTQQNKTGYYIIAAEDNNKFAYAPISQHTTTDDFIYIVQYPNNSTISNTTRFLIYYGNGAQSFTGYYSSTLNPNEAIDISGKRLGGYYFYWNTEPENGNYHFTVTKDPINIQSVNVQFDSVPSGSNSHWFIYASYVDDEGKTHYRVHQINITDTSSHEYKFTQLGTGGNLGESGLADIPEGATVAYKLLHHTDQNNITENGVIKDDITQIDTNGGYCAGYHITYDSDSNTFCAAEYNYPINVVFPDNENPTGNWRVYASVTSGGNTYYQFFTPVFTNGQASITVNKGNDRLATDGNGQGANVHYVTPDDTVNVILLYNGKNENFADGGNIHNDATQITDGTKINGYTFTFADNSPDAGITITGTKDPPYRYVIKAEDASGNPITSGLNGNYYAVGMITRKDGNNRTVYYQEKAVDLSAITETNPQAEGTFDGNYTNNGSTTNYSSGNVVNTAVGTISGNYSDDNLYTNGEIIQISGNRYQVHVTDNRSTGVSTITLKKLPDYQVTVSKTENTNNTGHYTLSGAYQVVGSLSHAENGEDVVYSCIKDVTIGENPVTITFDTFVCETDSNKTTVYTPDDVMTVTLRKTDGDTITNYSNGEIADGYTVSVTNTDHDSSTMTLTELQKLRIQTLFDPTSGASDTVANGYNVLVSIRDTAGNMRYTLKPISNIETEIDTYLDHNGSGTYYYTGTETVQAALVQGTGTTIADALQDSKGKRYDEGFVIPELYYATVTTTDHLVTNTLKKVSATPTAHTIEVSFYETRDEDNPYSSTNKIPEHAFQTKQDDETYTDNQYFFRLRLRHEGQVVAYAIVPATGFASVAAQNGSYSLPVNANQNYDLVDANGNNLKDQDNQNITISYDPSLFTMDVRMYRQTANDLPSTLSDTTSRGTDDITGFDFWENTSAVTDDGNGGSNYSTNIKLYGKYHKKYQVVIESDTAMNFVENDKVQLKVEAEHASSGTDLYTGTVTAASEYTVTITIQDEANNINLWTVESGRPGNVGGFETFTVRLLQNSKEISENSLVHDSAGTYFTVSFAKEQTKDYGQTDRTTTITDYVTLSKYTGEAALTPESVLGDAVEFGIVAHRYNQEGHTETNFAVHEFNDNSNFDIGGAGSNDMPIYVGEILGTLRPSSGTNVNIDVFCTQADIEAGKIDDKTDNKITLYPMEKDDINNHVSSLINYGTAQSQALSSHEPTMTVDANDHSHNIDTTAYPDNTTIYVNCTDSLMEVTGWQIDKLPGQTIVFNIAGTNTIEINKFKVITHNTNGTTTETESDTKNSDYSENGVGDPKNQQVDREILQHIVFNAYQASKVNLITASGLFLAPNADVSQINGAGWILTSKTVNSRAEWHFYRHTRHYNSITHSDTVSIPVKKVDESNVPMGYISFTLTPVPENSDASPSSITETTISDGTLTITIPTEWLGESTEDKIFELTETLPDGYTGTCPWTITVHPTVVTKITATDEEVTTDTFYSWKTTSVVDSSDNPVSFNHGLQAYKVVNTSTQQKGSIKLTKTGANNAKLSGAKFNLYRVKTGTETADIKINTETLETDSKGEITVGDLNPGTYYFVETEAPSGYVTPTGDAAKTETREVHAGQTTPELLTVSMTNTRKTGTAEVHDSIEIDKTDGTNVLGGAVFALKSGNTEVSTYTTNATTGKATISTGEEKLKNYLPAAGQEVELALTEKTPPPGHEAIVTTWTVKITASEATAYDQNQDKFITTKTYTMKVNNGDKIDVTNTRKTGFAEVHDSIEIDKTDGANALGGAVFVLKSGDTEISTYTTDTTTGKATISTGDEKLKNYLPAAEAETVLTLTEKMPPPGHEAIATTWTVKITASEATAYDQNQDKFITTKTYTMKVNNGDKIDVTNTRKTGFAEVHDSIEIDKTDGANALGGAVFVLKSGDTEISTYTTDTTTGKATISTGDEKLKNYLPATGAETVLTLTEKMPPPGHEAIATKWTVRITASEATAYDQSQDKFITTKTYTMKVNDGDKIDVTNTRKTGNAEVHDSIEIDKTDGTNALGGAIFVLKSGDTEITTYTTDTTTGKVTISTEEEKLKNYLPAAGAETILTLTENTPPCGHEATATTWTVKITASEATAYDQKQDKFITTKTYTMKVNNGDKIDVTNIRKTGTAEVHDSVEIDKTDGTKALGGAVFALKSGDTEITTYTTDTTTGKAIISTEDEKLKNYLPAAGQEMKLTLTEKTPPPGHEAIATTWTVKITASEATAYDSAQDKFITTKTYTMKINNGDKIDVTNTRKTGSDVVHDSVEINKTDGTKPLGGAVFALKSGNTEIKTYTTDETTGKVTISTEEEKLKNYMPAAGAETILTLTEKTPPDGYEPITTTWTVKITANEATAYNQNQDKFITTKTYTMKIDNGNKIVVTNTKKTSNDNEAVEIKLHKKTDSNENLSGVTFTLTDSTKATVASGQTADDGMLTLTIPKTFLGTHNGENDKGENATSKNFTLTETVPTGYEDVRPWTVTVKADGISQAEVNNVTVTTYKWLLTGIEGLTADATTAVYEITNKLQAGTLTIKKRVVGAENAATKPTSYKVTVTTEIAGATKWIGADGSVHDSEVKIDVPLTEEGIIICGLPYGSYTVTECEEGREITDYQLEVTGEGTAEIDQQHPTAEIVLVNTYDMMLTSAAVMKVWEDDNNRDGLRPAGLTVELLADGQPTGRTVTLNAANHWTAVLKDLPAVKDSKTVVYTWQEPKVEGYTLTSSKADGATLTTLTNTHVPAKTEISVKKVWEDSNDAARKRPSGIEVQLYADGRALGETVTLDAANGWAYTWKDLYLNTCEDGTSRAIRYTVAETEIPDGYTGKTTGNASTGFVITNTYNTGKLIIEKTFDIQKPEEGTEEEEELTDFEVQKIWMDDNDNADGNRPESITVHLYAGGEEIKAVQLKAANGWKYHFGELPKYADGKPIHYSVSEDPVEGYSTEIDGFTIYNKYQPERTQATVRKIWNDENDKQKKRPESIWMKLSNGTIVMLSEENGWTASIADLPAKVNGKPADYTWTEQTTMGYELETVVQEGSVTTFTNKPWTRPEQPSQGKKPKTAGETLYVFDEYDTPLGVEIVINHVGDCFD